MPATTQTSDDTTLPANLPDPLRFDDGTAVSTPQQWCERRRGELLATFAREMYGPLPPKPAKMTFERVEEDRHALGGNATRRQIVIHFDDQPDGPRMDLLVYLPNDAGPVPLIFGLNFWGNHAVTTDPGVHLSTSYIETGLGSFIDLSGVKDHRATDASRGTDAKRWPIEQILARGYGFATAYRGDIDPDLANLTDRPAGFRPSIREAHGGTPDAAGSEFGALTAWAWACSRAMDYFDTDKAIDAGRVALFGWSRLGKAALWAAANDERFALMISSESGAGGATLFHHNVGEDIHRLTTRFPQWFARRFATYDGKERSLPFDQHELLALIAPRPLYVAASQGDKIFDPVGDFMSLKAADRVYRFLGTLGLPDEPLPPLDHPIADHLAYHRRTGGHDVLPFDWEQYLKFCDTRLR